MQDRQERLEAAITGKEKDLIELKKTLAQVKLAKKDQASSVRKRLDKSFNLFSVMEKLATEHGVMSKVDYMRPGNLLLDDRREEKWVEIKLNDVTLKELTNYLYGLRSSDQSIYIKRLSAKREGEYLRLVLQPAVTVAR